MSNLSQVATHQRLVLIVDTYEQMTTLDEWMRGLARIYWRYPDTVQRSP
ncbi:MAG: hypothetical protein ACJ8CB_12690 [Ktedonobacteraceae bacterium]